MKYDHILVRVGELALKGKNRSVFEKALASNINVVLKGYDIKVHRMFGRIMIELHDAREDEIIEKLKDVFGIHSFSLALKVENELEAIQKGALAALMDSRNQPVRTFKVTAKRPNKNFPIGSQSLNPLIGGYVLQNTEDITVNVHEPDVEIRVEVREQATYITCGNIPGAGGLPVGTGGKVMLMLSGGIDSPVAGYLTMKRGVKINAIHFHSPPYTNERAKEKVKELVRILTKYCGTIQLHLVPFTEMQTTIHEKVPGDYAMTIMRRMMMRISEKIANNQKQEALAITTGESLGQVASQTLHSMNAINEVTNLPIIRPLVTMDKLEVIEIAKKIGTYETSILPFEDCCTIFLPPNSKTRPRRELANKFEGNFDFASLVDKAVAETEVITIRNQPTKEEQSVDDLF
ncbi:tRNA uracil 4-sulfurtransferase ThiI [Alkalihalobacterium chitinilyticum]|uniref:Probable tRNA sulfurtransferase n=1 Tax=Alkalihalobacterium chitinilyticum TaxID=2980103 RepID=A0ABT5VKG4_9BACI|nr:tRNA uracil 4-sulfurtransferase ThiI [Alkalihalobacterium chitinilyticum]MDE5415899.1 tRNA 4-thiouridine(8) synthase ThiI [Alkalihalobacterium chitinilyticum]